MKYQEILLPKQINVTLFDGIKPAVSAKVIGFAFRLYSKGGTLKVKAKVKSSYGTELTDLNNIYSNL
jgi:hypothetical protein